MTQIDKYIAKATAGLPTRERIDTAAELRVHLNAQAKKHMLEGHTNEEAEFLAVDAMGAVATVNRQFLGHIFTPRVGWGVLITSVIGLAGWFGGKAFLENQTYAREIPVNVKDILPSLGNYWSFEYRVPQGTKSYYLAFNNPIYGQSIFQHSNLDLTDYKFTNNLNSSRSLDKRTVKILIWQSKQDYTLCNAKSNRLYHRTTQNDRSVESYVQIPCKINGEDVQFAPLRALPIHSELNKWQPLLELQPQERIAKQSSPFRDFNPNQSIVLQVYASTEALITNGSPRNDDAGNPPPFWDSESDFSLNNLQYNTTNGQSDIHLNLPKNTKSFEVAASATGKMYLGKTFDLTIRPSVNKIDMSLYANDFSNANKSTNEDCSFIQRNIRIALSPGNILITPCTPFLTKDTPINTYFGAHIQPQKIPTNIPLETWIPVYALPAHHKPKEYGIPPVIRDVNQWYVVMVKFSSKRQYDGNLPKPAKPFKFRLKNNYVYSSLEVVK